MTVNDHMTKKQRTKLKAVAYYQILGGAFGLCVISYSILTTLDISYLSTIILGLFSALYFFSIYCGQQLIQGKVNRGLRLSKVNQLLQVIHISLLGFTYKYVSGLMVTIGIDYTTDFNLLFNFVLSTFDLTISPNSDKVIIGINLTSIYIIYLLEELKQRFSASVETSTWQNITLAKTPWDQQNSRILRETKKLHHSIIQYVNDSKNR